ncbi:GNAT family N-acetyltransferase [Rubinisphaera sp.]|uniref:GNAT family N-acetyltransferase n=1 Tax=Rubinisphaera sp. TaxID=2024857 RepID=UPI000C0F8991|nr:GNAT family N-acetyltransferase [Rubinisphaera sp.]MBV08580.1 GNAT family N-acetyltransferase [Rubinisphaera sp.]HCS53026.1 GNAT family N-acetyltransferase [Planctomycetaceae bacterium]|tara:strand:+ start:2072 stop:2467 length:396 start_codon:yes stop_codon:yes gene_type:complete
MPEIHYEQSTDLSVDDYIDILKRSTLAERRPIDQLELMRKAVTEADVIVTARIDNTLVGIARSLTDYSACIYVADLAVDEAFQGRGMGKQLLDLTHEICGLHTKMILLAAPKAETYYPHIGMTQHHSCWIR